MDIYKNPITTIDPKLYLLLKQYRDFNDPERLLIETLKKSIDDTINSDIDTENKHFIIEQLDKYIQEVVDRIIPYFNYKELKEDGSTENIG